MRKIEINNPELDRTFKTRLTVDYSSGTALTVESSNSFSSNDLLVIGDPREELTESKKLSSVTDITTFSLASALNFQHPKGTSLYKTPWDYVSIERRSSSAGVFAEISQSGIQWDNPSGLTLYTDLGATDNYQYRFRFLNSVTSEYSEYSPTLTGAGFTRRQVGYMIRQVRTLTNDLERLIVKDEEIIRAFNIAQDIIYAFNPKLWFLLVDTYQQADSILAIANTNVYSLAQYETFGHLDTLRYQLTNGGNTSLYPLTKKSSFEFDRITQNQNDGPFDEASIFKLLPVDANSANGYIQVYPKTLTSGVGIFYPNYYEKMQDLNSVDDETQVILPQLLEDYAIGYVERIKGNEAKAKFYESSLVSDSATQTPRGLGMLLKMDAQQKQVVGQPRNLWNYRGQKAIHNSSGAYRNRDFYRENYMD